MIDIKYAFSAVSKQNLITISHFKTNFRSLVMFCELKTTIT